MVAGKITVYISTVAKQSSKEFVLKFQTTIPYDTGITRPFGKEKITPVPIVAGKLILLKKETGIVGFVAQAKAD